MVDQDAPDPQFDAMTARLLRREALRRAAEELNTLRPGLKMPWLGFRPKSRRRPPRPEDPAMPGPTFLLSPKLPEQELTRMARETIYVVQAFNAAKGARLSPDTPIRCKSAEIARRTAEKLAPTKGGVVAFSTSGDAELDDYDDTIIFKVGRLPAPFEGA